MCIVYNKYLTEAGAYPHLPTQPIFFITLKLIQQSKVLHMCFERFILSFESCDLSQADKRIIKECLLFQASMFE